MAITWFIGKRCNYSCSYCTDVLHDNYSAHVPFAKMKIFVDQIVARYGTNVSWTLVGGEPTINPDFFKLLDYLQDKKYEIAVGTNGSRSLDFLKKTISLSDHLTYSIHFEYVSAKLDEEIEKVIELEKWRVQCNIDNANEIGNTMAHKRHKSMVARVMAVAGFGKEFEKTTLALRSAGVKSVETRVIRPQADEFVRENKTQLPNGQWVWKLHHEKTEIVKTTKVAPDKSNLFDQEELMLREERFYTDEEREAMERLYKEVGEDRKNLTKYFVDEDGTVTSEHVEYNSMNYRGESSFKGWKCTAGVTCLKIAPNGDIFVANCYQGGVIANLYTLAEDDQVSWPTGPITCAKFRCTDPADLKQPKYASDEYRYLVE